jgi:hypothetical protein
MERGLFHDGYDKSLFIRAITTIIKNLRSILPFSIAQHGITEKICQHTA